MRVLGPLRGPYVFAKSALQREGLLEVTVSSVGPPLLLRARTSDRATFEQVFVSKDYDLSFLNIRPHVIIDGGANVGLATRFFAHSYPWAHIFAVEPEASN